MWEIGIPASGVVEDSSLLGCDVVFPDVSKDLVTVICKG
jgi:hypothetical protein